MKKPKRKFSILRGSVLYLGIVLSLFGVLVLVVGLWVQSISFLIPGAMLILTTTRFFRAQLTSLIQRARRRPELIKEQQTDLNK